ncbi:hypothetical protein [Dankookia sp. P2]|uniref:hypothetical protein n=1 Tax=Dankookia sp. P2 TaxID=3423955 RepID=UPI003D67DCAD
MHHRQLAGEDRGEAGRFEPVAEGRLGPRRLARGDVDQRDADLRMQQDVRHHQCLALEGAEVALVEPEPARWRIRSLRRRRPGGVTGENGLVQLVKPLALLHHGLNSPLDARPQRAPAR